MTLYESSSGNTAKALAMLSAARGYKFVAIVDKHAPADKLNAIRAYGGELHFCADQEDAYFYKHWGFNPVSIVKAFNENWMIKNELMNKQVVNELTQFYI